MIKIAIAEDNAFLAKSLINKLGLVDEFKVKQQAVDGEDLLSQLERDSNLDVILMDIQMPNMDGVKATAEVTKRYPHIKVIMLTVVDTEQRIYESIRAGAVGYLVKESSPSDIKDGVLKCLEGGAHMSPEIARKAMKIIQEPNVIDRTPAKHDLSDRELDVLTHLSKGLNYQQIASNLIISPNTVRRHIENIYRKLEVHNKAEAIHKAFQDRLI